jgi:hypothetical protein
MVQEETGEGRGRGGNRAVHKGEPILQIASILWFNIMIRAMLIREPIIEVECYKFD